MESTETIDAMPMTDSEAENAEPTLDSLTADALRLYERWEQLGEKKREKQEDLKVAEQMLEAQYREGGDEQTIAKLEGRIGGLQTSIKAVDAAADRIWSQYIDATGRVKEEKSRLADARRKAAQDRAEETAAQLLHVLQAFFAELVTPLLERHGDARREQYQAWIDYHTIEGTLAAQRGDPPPQHIDGELRALVDHLEKFLRGMLPTQIATRNAVAHVESARRAVQQRRERDAQAHTEAVAVLETSPRCKAESAQNGRQAAYMLARHLVEEAERLHVDVSTLG
jgi:hypothetical protein